MNVSAGDAWDAASRRGDYVSAWAIADAVLAARLPGTSDDPSRPYHERCVWDGRPFDGQDVLVRCYHGLGDTLQFVRFLPLLRLRAAFVTLEAQPELVPLLRDIAGADRVIPFDVDAPAPASCAIEIMELPHALREPPMRGAYLTVPPDIRGEGRVGVCWRAGGWDPRRSISLDALRPALPADAISLQRGETGLPDPLDGTMDIVATARLITALDRIVTVDTMIAHLAGALGRPVDILLHHAADWRWGSGPTTEWYATARLFRQPAAGDWDGAVTALLHATAAR